MSRLFIVSYECSLYVSPINPALLILVRKEHTIFKLVIHGMSSQLTKTHLEGC